MNSNMRCLIYETCVALLTLCVLPRSFAHMPPSGDETIATFATQHCASCHGLRGDSLSPLVPTLSAQQADYLKAEILDFKTHERSELLARKVMQNKVVGVDDATAAALAHYYARQPAVPGVSGDPQRTASGKAVFERGTESQAACATCHGERAEGVGIFPRLAGQHAVYLQYQLRVKQHESRRTSVMHGIIGDLTEDDMVNLSVYLQSIP